MRRHAISLMLTLSLVVAACSGETSRPVELSPDDRPPVPDTAETTAPPATTTTPTLAPRDSTPVPTAEPGPIPAAAAGRLVIIDPAGNIVTVDPDGADPVVVADARAEGAVFFQPLWSPASNEIAWSQAGPTGSTLQISADDGSTRRAAGMISAPFYIHWAPDGAHIAVLHNDATGSIEMEMVDTAGATSLFTTMGAPFYFSWSPEASDMAVHIGGADLLLIGTDGATTDLGATSAGYQAPHWVRDGIIHIDQDELVLARSNGASSTLAAVPGPVTFVANPQASLIALQAAGPDNPVVEIALQAVPDVPANVVIVLDPVTGEFDLATNRPSIGFFWSPDGEKLLILEAAGQRGEAHASVWEGGDARRLVTYVPPLSFLQTVLPFVGQYAQSYQPWSPDSSAFAFAGGIGTDFGIWVQPVDGGNAAFVAEGGWVAWSSL